MFSKVKYIFILFFAIVTGNTAFAQVYSASAKLDSSKIQIGGQCKLQLKVFVPAEVMKQKDKFVQWQVLGDTISKEIEIVEAGPIDTVLSADKKTYFLTKTLTITSFDSGFQVIPPFRFLKDGNSERYFETQALLLEVTSVPVNADEDIRDIKDPIEIPFSLTEALPYIFAFLALLALGIYLFRYFKKKNIITPIILEKEPELPPHAIALQKIEELKAQELWQQGHVKQYHSVLTDILRVYLEQRFTINALEQTSDEILSSCRSLPIQEHSKSGLQQLLQLADLVKFAKTMPLPDQNVQSITHAIAFINATVPLEEVKKTEIIKEDKHV
jgi:hypothetical protein